LDALEDLFFRIGDVRHAAVDSATAPAGITRINLFRSRLENDGPQTKLPRSVAGTQSRHAAADAYKIPLLLRNVPQRRPVTRCIRDERRFS
jgi:hypothetical protein